jgi:hypothetical protein
MLIKFLLIVGAVIIVLLIWRTRHPIDLKRDGQ